MRILIAEDDPLTLCSLETKLRRWGYDTVTAVDGNEAWEALQSADAPRLAILDWSMPGFSGVDLVRKIRAQADHEYVYIFLLTGKTQMADMVEGFEAGADDYITKPFNPDELQARLRTAERILDLHEKVQREHLAREAAQARLMQVRKLEAVGQLASGIAHEINTPLQYTGDNTRFAQDSFKDISGVIIEFRRLLEAVQSGSHSPQQIDQVQTLIKEIDIDYLLQETPQAIAQSLEGIESVTKIVAAMKEFSRPGVEHASVDINKSLDSTITICRNEWKYVADLTTNLDDDLPSVPCFPSELSTLKCSNDDRPSNRNGFEVIMLIALGV